MAQVLRQAVVDFYRYPPVGGDDWRYAFGAACVRALEAQMLTKTTLLDMANAPGYEQAVELLSSGDYTAGQTKTGFAELENILASRRAEVRNTFEKLMIDARVVKLFRSRTDFANLKLALRRMLTEKPIGGDYSGDGNILPGQFAEIFEQENYALLGEYLSGLAEQVVLGYYQNKDIRQIDYTIDASAAQHNFSTADKFASVFLAGLFRIQIDLINIRTMFRLKLTESEQRNVFLAGGFIETARFRQGLDIGNESVAQLFFATPYYEAVQAGAGYIASQKSFLKLEQQCDEYLNGYLGSTSQITAGPQPIIAYLLAAEYEIRTVRLILTAKRNNLNPKLILDRLG